MSEDELSLPERSRQYHEGISNLKEEIGDLRVTEALERQKRSIFRELFKYGLVVLLIIVFLCASSLYFGIENSLEDLNLENKQFESSLLSLESKFTSFQLELSTLKSQQAKLDSLIEDLNSVLIAEIKKISTSLSSFN